MKSSAWCCCRCYRSWFSASATHQQLNVLSHATVHQHQQQQSHWHLIDFNISFMALRHWNAQRNVARTFVPCKTPQSRSTWSKRGAWIRLWQKWEEKAAGFRHSHFSQSKCQGRNSITSCQKWSRSLEALPQNANSWGEMATLVPVGLIRGERR